MTTCGGGHPYPADLVLDINGVFHTRALAEKSTTMMKVGVLLVDVVGAAFYFCLDLLSLFCFGLVL